MNAPVLTAIGLLAGCPKRVLRETLDVGAAGNANWRAEQWVYTRH